MRNPMLPMLLACAGPPTGAPEPGAAIDTAAVDSMPEVVVEIPAPSWTASEVADRITATAAFGVPEPITVRDQLFALLENRDPDCPGGTGYTLPGLFQGCLTETGWRYAGVLEYSGPDPEDVLGDFSVMADSYIVSPDGETFIGAGELDFAITGEAPLRWTGWVSGQWSYPPASTWMRDGYGSAVLSIDATVPSTADWSVTLDGGIYLDGTALWLRSLRADALTCNGEPSGQIEVRDPTGYAYHLTVACGCGPLTWADGTDMGEVCISAAAPLAALVAMGVP